mmetsp:Transcript_6661/g.14552  ORF Transcript_6661/g.14552 Transcript_6661/m.14552 type:complete len:434 (-) Transcript_6661:151-1452(-)
MLAPESVRKHGFELPFHPLQVLSWVIFTADVIVFALLSTLLYTQDECRLALQVCFGASVGVVVIAWALASSCDPAVPEEEQTAGELSEPDPTVVAEAPRRDCWCDLCSRKVPSRSKHCRDCNKCTDLFDHHCKWLNTCIGRRNYPWFIGAICGVAIMTGIALVSSAHLFVLIVTCDRVTENRIEALEVPAELLLTLLGTLVVVNLPLYLLDSQLIILHMYLTSRGLTTYEYIIQKCSLRQARIQAEREGAAGRHGSHPQERTLPWYIDWIVFRYRKKSRSEASSSSMSIAPAAVSKPEDGSGALSKAPSTDSATRKPKRTQVLPLIEGGIVAGRRASKESLEADKINSGSTLDKRIAAQQGAITLGMPVEGERPMPPLLPEDRKQAAAIPVTPEHKTAADGQTEPSEDTGTTASVQSGSSSLEVAGGQRSELT